MRGKKVRMFEGKTVTENEYIYISCENWHLFQEYPYRHKFSSTDKGGHKGKPNKDSVFI
jgi:hypothetical protein